MSETLWAPRPLPSLERPDGAVWRGAPATLAELRALRMQLRAALSEDRRPARATDDDVERLLLAFEELVSNGLRHGEGPVEATVTTGEGGWLLEVRDGAGRLASGPRRGPGRRARRARPVPRRPTERRPRMVRSGRGAQGRLGTGGRHRGAGRVRSGARGPAGADSGSAGRQERRPDHPAPAREARSLPGGAPAGRAVPRRLSVVVTAVVLVLALVLAVLAATANAHSNQRLLQQQVDQAATLLRTPARRAADPADRRRAGRRCHDRPPAPFLRFASAAARAPGTSLSLWRVSGGTVRPVAVPGTAARLPRGRQPGPALPVAAADRSAHGGRSRRRPASEPGLCPDAGRRAGRPGRLRRGAADPARLVPPGGPFSGVDLAVYLGPVQAGSQLVQATAPVPIRGERATTRVPFGDSSFLVVAAAQTGLTGSLSAALTWIVLGAGGLLALATGTTVEMLSRRRVIAERLAAVDQRMYQQQRSIAGTLQHALLPELPQLANVEAGARYVAGGDDLEVGSDWSDVIPGPSGRCVFVVGDISGQGLRAATTMAELRFAVRAYLVQGDDIATVLTKLRGLLDIDTDHQFATLVLGGLDPVAGGSRLSSAGHFSAPGDRARAGHVPRRPGRASGRGAGRGCPGRRRGAGQRTGGSLLAFADGAMEPPGGGCRTGLEHFALDSGTRRGAAPVSVLRRRAGDSDGRSPRGHGDLGCAGRARPSRSGRREAGPGHPDRRQRPRGRRYPPAGHGGVQPAGCPHRPAPAGDRQSQ